MQEAHLCLTTNEWWKLMMEHQYQTAFVLQKAYFMNFLFLLLSVLSNGALDYLCHFANRVIRLFITCVLDLIADTWIVKKIRSACWYFCHTPVKKCTLHSVISFILCHVCDSCLGNGISYYVLLPYIGKHSRLTNINCKSWTCTLISNDAEMLTQKRKCSTKLYETLMRQPYTCTPSICI